MSKRKITIRKRIKGTMKIRRRKGPS